MQNIKVLAKSASRVASNNAPAILTAFAVVGVATTTVFAVKATPKALGLIEAAEENSEETLTVPQKIRVTLPCYLPALGMGAATMACIIGANTTSMKRNAAMISAFSLSESAFKEYQSKVVETLGEKKEQVVRDEIAQDRVRNHPPVEGQVVFAGAGKVLCYEMLTGRYFESTHEDLRRAENNVNKQIINDMYASQNDFYREIGLSPTKMGDELGWNTDRLLELQFSTTLSEDNRPCLAVDYRVHANRGYHKFG